MTHAATSHPHPPASPPPAPAAHTTTLHLWDLPLRLFHWSLVLAVSTAIATGLKGGEWMELHGQAGLTIVGLLVFRVLWGVFGSTHARFATFWPTPRLVWAYLRGQWQGVGHNPLGAVAVLLMLGLLATQVGTGLFGNDDIAFTGPLASRVSEDLSLWLTGWHRQLATLLYGVLGLHVGAIVFYVLVKKQDLVKPMFTGKKRVPATTHHAQSGSYLALLLAVLLALGAVFLANGGWASSTSTTSSSDTATAAPASTTPSW